MIVKEADKTEPRERKMSNAQRSRVALAESVQRKLTENKKVQVWLNKFNARYYLVLI